MCHLMGKLDYKAISEIVGLFFAFALKISFNSKIVIRDYERVGFLLSLSDFSFTSNVFSILILQCLNMLLSLI